MDELIRALSSLFFSPSFKVFMASPGSVYALVRRSTSPSLFLLHLLDELVYSSLRLRVRGALWFTVGYLRGRGGRSKMSSLELERGKLCSLVILRLVKFGRVF